MKNHIERLKDLREDNDLTQEEVGKIIGTTKQYYQKYEKGTHPLPIRHLVKLAKYYQTSTDYLLGLTDVCQPYPPPEQKG